MSTLPAHLDHPAVATFCTTCPTFELPLDACADACCSFAWQRQGYEDRKRRDERDAVRRGDHAGREVDEPSVCLTTDCIGMSNPITECERTRCPVAGERRREEDLIEREKKDEKAKED